MTNLQLTRQNLRAMSRYQPDPDLRSDDAFLIRLFRSYTTIAIFERLIKWLPQGKRKDGGIYKSDKELAWEMGISTKTVERSRKILKEAGFDIRVMKANGAPTNHYYFNLEKFLAFVAQKLHSSTENVRLWLAGKTEPKAAMESDNLSESSPSSCPDEAQPGAMESDNLSKSPDPLSRNEIPPISLLEFDKLAESLTIPNNSFSTAGNRNTAATNSKDDAVAGDSLRREVQALQLQLGTSEADLQHWITIYGLEAVKAFTRLAMGDQRIYNKGGWVRQALSNNYSQANKPKVQAEMTAEELGKMYTSGSKYADFIKY